MKHNVTLVGRCSFCNRDCSTCTPYAAFKNLQDSPLWCEDCAHKETSILLVSIEQNLRDNKRVIYSSFTTFTMRHIVVNADVDPITNTTKYHFIWFEDGMLNIEHRRVKEFNEYQMDVENTILHLADLYQKGYIFCTGCGNLIRYGNIAGRPLFAGATCEKCWEKHLEKLEKEKAVGHVCGKCRRPYSACCC